MTIYILSLIFVFYPGDIFQREYYFKDLSTCQEAVEKIGKDTQALKANNSVAVIAFCKEKIK